MAGSASVGGAPGTMTGGSGGSIGGTGGAMAGAGGTIGGSAGAAGQPACSATPPVVAFTKNIRVNDDTGNGNQAEVALATGPNGLAIAAWGDSRAERTCTFSVSKDGGATWGKNVAIKNVAGQFVGDPAAAIDAGGTLYAACQEYVDVDAGQGNVRLMTSTDQGTTWSSVQTIQAAPDKPWVGGGVTEGTVFVSWLGRQAGIKRSTDRGKTWGATQPLGNIIHGTAIVASESGLVHVPYNLDSQNNQLRYLRSTDGGGTWEKTRDLVSDMGAFCFDCNPRQHPIVGAASDPTGKVTAITWTSRMSGGQGDDDVWLIYSKDGGTTWTRPLRVNDNTAASRQFQSWVAVDRCGRVHVAWTDLRNGKNEVWYARSAEPTEGFEPNLQITDGSGSANTDFLGDYKGLAITGNDVLAVWQDTRRDSGDIYSSRAVGAAGP
jgi:Neuraminidase (sialidase)